jgi:hypothetical protein
VGDGVDDGLGHGPRLHARGRGEGRERGGGGRGHGGKSDDGWMSAKWSLFPDGAGDQQHASAPFDAPSRSRGAHNNNAGVEEGLLCGGRWKGRG